LLVVTDSAIERVGRVVIPVGIIRIERVTEAGASVEATLVAKFAQVPDAAIVLPLDDALPPATARPVPVVNGATVPVVVVLSDAMLPTLQHIVLLGGGTTAGLRAGDRVVLSATASASRDRRVAPGAEIGAAVVLRVTSHFASALIVRQSEAAIVAGSSARVTATLPPPNATPPR
jgi:hypothetical protein